MRDDYLEISILSEVSLTVLNLSTALETLHTFELQTFSHPSCVLEHR